MDINFKKFDVLLNEEEIFKRFEKGKVDINNPNNIFLKCQISKQEALDGCTKQVKYKQTDENEKENKNIIDVKIPKGIQKGQSIIYYNQGNYIKELETRSNIIIEIEIK